MPLQNPDHSPWLRLLLGGVFSCFLAPSTATAFCGFYVGGEDGSEMFNDATEVVLMRHGTQTVMSMRNRYQGDPEDFAMVVPVPQILEAEDVKTLDPQLFSKIDTLGSPRLVEYWEQDPCRTGGEYWNNVEVSADGGGPPREPSDIVVEAEFSVGEYDVVVLSAEQGSSLDTYLDQSGYAVPRNAAEYYQPYIDGGQYFFVAKVDSSKVTFRDGEAVLSPLRFSFDSEEFSLPIRLGLINSSGEQDLIVHILADGQRYEVANYPNVTIPTNIAVVDDVREDFGSFYRALFARTLKENPAAAVTEYSWAASGCDPCPGPVALGPEDFMTLGQDVLNADDDQGRVDWTLTRIHTRYDKSQVGEDLIFHKAGSIVGGREIYDEGGNLETGAVPSEFRNAFQARYIIRHQWDGAVSCTDPNFGIWGGDPTSNDPWGEPNVSSAQGPNSTSSAFPGNEEDVPLEEQIVDDIPELDLIAIEGPEAMKSEPKAGCASVSVGHKVGSGLFLLGAFLWGGATRRRRK